MMYNNQWSPELMLTYIISSCKKVTYDSAMILVTVNERRFNGWLLKY